MRVSRIARGAFCAGLATTAAFAASFIHLDAQLSHGVYSSLATEGTKTLGLAATNIVLWSIAFRARVLENRMEASLARKEAKRRMADQIEIQEELTILPTPMETLEAA